MTYGAERIESHAANHSCTRSSASSAEPTIGRPGDAITAGITTAVVMVVAAVSPHDAWQQPILRFADTVIGVAVGVAAAWTGLRVIRPVTQLARQPGGKQADTAGPRSPGDGG